MVSTCKFSSVVLPGKSRCLPVRIIGDACISSINSGFSKLSELPDSVPTFHLICVNVLIFLTILFLFLLLLLGFWDLRNLIEPLIRVNSRRGLDSSVPKDATFMMKASVLSCNDGGYSTSASTAPTRPGGFCVSTSTASRCICQVSAKSFLTKE